MAGKAISRDAVTAAVGASAAAMAWRFKGELRITVVAKATFGFAHEGPMPRAKPKDIVWDEIHHGNHPARSIRFTPDVAPRLGRADVLFTGHAFAPPGAALPTAPIRLAVFDGASPLLDKTLFVRRQGSVQGIPVVYEGAYGGIGWADNPFGVGLTKESKEPVILDPFDPERTAGFGPIARAWPRRKRLFPAMPKGALRADVIELPADFQWEYFQAAPADQQIGFLKGDEWIVLDALHEAHPRIRMRLPSARAVARVHGLAPFGVREGEPLELTLDLLHVDGEEQCVTATFRTSFAVPSEDALPAVRLVVGVATEGEPIAWPAGDEPGDEAPTRKNVARTLPRVPIGSGTVALQDGDPPPARLPFATILLDDSDDDPTIEKSASAFAGKPGRRQTETIQVTALPAPEALPFKPPTKPSPMASPAPSGVRPARKAPDDLRGTMTLGPDEIARVAERKPPIPFGRRAPSPAGPPPPRMGVPVPRPSTPSSVPGAPAALRGAPVAPPSLRTGPATVPAALPSSPAVPPSVRATTPDLPTAPIPLATPAPPPEKPASLPEKPAAAPEKAAVAPAKSGSPWAAPVDEPPAPRAPKPPQKPAAPPTPSPALKRGLYDRFGKP